MLATFLSKILCWICLCSCADLVLCFVVVVSERDEAVHLKIQDESHHQTGHQGNQVPQTCRPVFGKVHPKGMFSAHRVNLIKCSRINPLLFCMSGAVPSRV